jgi:membrane protease YdiL (CAAX protease family)
MQKINKVSIIAMIVMAVISFTNLFGWYIAGFAVCLGVIAFFIDKAIEKQPFSGSGLDFKAIGANLKGGSIWFWLLLPLIMDIVSLTLGRLVVPGYIDHILSRASAMISFDKSLISVAQMAFLALGEEIAWRAFFQKQAVKRFPLAPVLLVSGALFGLGHIAAGPFFIVTFDVFFVSVNSVLYGIIFHKTQNAWVSGLAHFAANLFSVIVLTWI